MDECGWNPQLGIGGEAEFDGNQGRSGLRTRRTQPMGYLGQRLRQLLKFDPPYFLHIFLWIGQSSFMQLEEQ